MLSANTNSTSYPLSDIGYDFSNAFLLASLPRSFVTFRRPPVEVTYQSPEPGALPPTLDQLAKKYRPLIDRVMARLTEAERREINTHYQADYRQSWICLSFANRGIAEPFVEASYVLYGLHPSKVWESIIADRQARLGDEYYRWYSSDHVLRPDVPRLPPRTATDGADLSGTVGGSVPQLRKEVV